MTASFDPHPLAKLPSIHQAQRPRSQNHAYFGFTGSTPMIGKTAPEKSDAIFAPAILPVSVSRRLMCLTGAGGGVGIRASANAPQLAELVVV